MDKIDVAHTVKLSSGVSTGCPFCSKSLEGEYIDKSINHLIQNHGGTLLHVGSEYGGSDDRGHSVHFTVALVGMQEIPPKREPVRFNIELVPGTEPT